MLALLTFPNIPLDMKNISSQCAVNFGLCLNQVKLFFFPDSLFSMHHRDSSNHLLTKWAELLMLPTLLTLSFSLFSTRLKSAPITIWLLPTDCTLEWMSWSKVISSVFGAYMLTNMYLTLSTNIFRMIQWALLSTYLLTISTFLVENKIATLSFWLYHVHILYFHSNTYAMHLLSWWHNVFLRVTLCHNSSCSKLVSVKGVKSKNPKGKGNLGNGKGVI